MQTIWKLLKNKNDWLVGLAGPGNTIWYQHKVNYFEILKPNNEEVWGNILLSSEISCRSGEFIIDTLDSVEDTKGNSGESGWLYKF